MSVCRANKQTYIGKVIHPAKYNNAGNKPFLTFSLYVDSHAFNPNKKEKESARISCSYTPFNENDPVGKILCRIATKENPDVGLGGNTYKSVLVQVEGQEKLVQVFNAEGEATGAYYKNLEYCTVTVVDTKVLDFYYQEKKAQTDSEESSHEGDIGAPAVAPGVVKAKPQTATRPVATQAARTTQKVYQVGDRIPHGGKMYEFTGGDSTNTANWKEVKVQTEDSPFTAPLSPFSSQMANTNNTTAKSILEASDSAFPAAKVQL